MARTLATGNDLRLTVDVGTAKRIHPVEIDAELGVLAAEFSLEGGLGFVPITVHGLERHDGWQLQIAEGDEWVRVEQSVHGNDYWQARYDGGADRYSLTWNVPNRGIQHYRVVWGSPSQ